MADGATTEPGDGAVGAQSVWANLPAVQRTGETTWRSPDHAFSEALLIREGLYRVDGGEAVAHAIRIMEDTHPGRRTVALNVVFVREGRHEHPTDYELTELYSGRNFTFVNVLASQPGRGAQAHVQATLAAAPEGPSHQCVSAPEVDWTGAAEDMGHMVSVPVQVAGGRKLGDPESGDVVVHIRIPLPADLRDGTEVRMYLAEVADHALTSPVFRPHAGVGYRTKGKFYTAPTGLQLRYWGEPQPGDVLTMVMTSPVMTNGVGFADAYAFDASGTVVFSCGMDVVVKVAD